MRKIIGWKESVDLPDLNIFGIPAKIDTGARTSVLHCNHIELVAYDGIQRIKFQPLDNRFISSDQTYLFPFRGLRTIKNSFGQEEDRYVINTVITLFGERYDIELSLRDRSEMEFPLLLGRKFIKRRFLVDVSKSNLSSSTPHTITTLS